MGMLFGSDVSAALHGLSERAYARGCQNPGLSSTRIDNQIFRSTLHWGRLLIAVQ